MNVQLCRHSTDGAEIALCVRLLNFWPSIVWKVRVMLSAAIIRLPAALPADLTLDMLCTGYLRMATTTWSMAVLLSKVVVNYEFNEADKWIVGVYKGEMN
jgi:hypothetical protein